MSDTPESDKAKIAFTSLFANDDAYWVPFKVSCKLERERDEALSDLEFRRDLFKLQEQQLNDVRAERDRLAEERDELAERITNEICRVSSVCRELKEELAVERALAERRGRLYDTAIGQLKKLQAQVDELNDKIRYNEVESSHNWRNRERDREAISAWKEARHD